MPLKIVHQAGRGNGPEVEARYRGSSRQNVRVVEFIDDVAGFLRDSDLVIGRAGASTLAEICGVGRPSVLIPYPFAASNHQLENARALERVGAAVCVPQAEASAERLAELLASLFADLPRLSAMAAAAQSWGRPDAAEVVARDLLNLAGLGTAILVESQALSGEPASIRPGAAEVSSDSRRATASIGLETLAESGAE
jgi:UDP-N-acetylglucosamine--N-acetylmuramyl-(pentapeptide) pyrophosphoryl-undecaprenol N-acetylglucosamine transferase